MGGATLSAHGRERPRAAGCVRRERVKRPKRGGQMLRAEQSRAAPSSGSVLLRQYDGSAEGRGCGEVGGEWWEPRVLRCHIWGTAGWTGGEASGSVASSHKGEGRSRGNPRRRSALPHSAALRKVRVEYHRVPRCRSRGLRPSRHRLRAGTDISFERAAKIRRGL